MLTQEEDQATRDGRVTLNIIYVGWWVCRADLNFSGRYSISTWSRTNQDGGCWSGGAPGDPSVSAEILDSTRCGRSDSRSPKQSIRADIRWHFGTAGPSPGY